MGCGSSNEVRHCALGVQSVEKDRVFRTCLCAGLGLVEPTPISPPLFPSPCTYACAASRSACAALHSSGLSRVTGARGCCSCLRADVLGTVHHAFTFELDEGLDALEDVIRLIETYDVTTIRAAVPMYLLCRSGAVRTAGRLLALLLRQGRHTCQPTPLTLVVRFF